MHLLFSFNKYLLSIDYLPGPILDTGDMLATKQTPVSAGVELTLQWAAKTGLWVPVVLWAQLGCPGTWAKGRWLGFVPQGWEGAIHNREGGGENWIRGNTVGRVQNERGESQEEGVSWVWVSGECSETVSGQLGPSQTSLKALLLQVASCRRVLGQYCWDAGRAWVRIFHRLLDNQFWFQSWVCNLLVTELCP